jgi:hypothetical protein
MKTLRNETITQSKNGETTVTTRTFKIKSKSEAILLVFPAYQMSMVLRVRSGVALSVLTAIFKYCDFNTNKIHLTSTRRKDLLNLLKIQKSHLSNALKELKKHNFIYGERDYFETNPYPMWRGTFQERSKFIKENKLELIEKFGFNEKDDLQERRLETPSQKLEDETKDNTD